MNPRWRDRLLAGLASAAAVWLSFNLAEGALLWPLLFGAIALGAIVVRLSTVPLDVVALGVLLIGYIVGNRGFAQIMVIPGVPLLPAEIGLTIAGAALTLRCAFGKTLPVNRDMLNYVLLAWILVGTARFLFDFREFGFVAARDYAMVYYTAFFFIAQHMGRQPELHVFLRRCLTIAAVGLPLIFALSETFPAFFLNTLTVRGVPLVFFKGDLVATFLAVAAILLYLTAARPRRWWAQPLATGMLIWVVAGDNRASMLGALVGLLWIAFSRFRRFPFTQAGFIAFAILIAVGLAGLGGNEWASRKLRGLTDRLMSVVDLTGRSVYRTEESEVKSDNNQFRWVWWKTVASDAMAQNPALGLGFGYDLARGFLQEYNPDMAEDFTARSPHNILVTTLGRLGLVGLGLFLAFLLILARRTWQAIRDPDADAIQVALWAAVWPIAVSAHLGVVLEGPMGAVVFWSLLGLAHSYRRPDQLAAAATDSESDDAIQTEENAWLAPARRRLE